MLHSLEIENFKSIYSDNIELGLINIFIGANGSGKSNILEAVAMLSAAKSQDLNPDGLTSKGVRVALPSLTFSSFSYKKQKNEFTIKYRYLKNGELSEEQSTLVSNGTSIYSEWKEKDDNYTKLSIDKQVDRAFTRTEYSKTINNNFEKILNEIDTNIINNENHIQRRGVIIKKLMEYLLIPDNIYNNLKNFSIYTANTEALRGISIESRKQPLGIYGEGLDTLIANLNPEEFKKLLGYTSLISWLDDIVISNDDNLKYLGHKLGRSNSKLYFKDRYMKKNNNVFSAENSNEGALHILFYLTLFISKATPSFFAIDNIENALNPSVCRHVIKELIILAKENNKQALITTHNPAILDGLNINDNDVRLFEVYRNDDGHTKTRRIMTKGENKEKLKLSEMWLRGYLGAINEDF